MSIGNPSTNFTTTKSGARPPAAGSQPSGSFCPQRHEVTLVSQVLDLFALTIYLHYAGDIENPLSFAYSIPVVAGAQYINQNQPMTFRDGCQVVTSGTPGELGIQYD